MVIPLSHIVYIVKCKLYGFESQTKFPLMWHINPDVIKVEVEDPPLVECRRLPGDGISASLQQGVQGKYRDVGESWTSDHIRRAD